MNLWSTWNKIKAVRKISRSVNVMEIFVPSVLPGPTLLCPLISFMDDLVALLLPPPLPLAVAFEVLWLWLCNIAWDCVELNKAFIEASWLVSGLETWFLEGTMVGGPGRRWIYEREGKCCESVFCCSMKRRKPLYFRICDLRWNPVNVWTGYTWTQLYQSMTVFVFSS